MIWALAIFGAQCAYLYPIYSRGQEKARASNCMSNLKQLAMGLSMYVDDYSDTLPSSRVPTNGSSPSSQQVTSFLTRNPVRAGGSNTLSSWVDCIWNYLGNSPDNPVYYCPSDAVRATSSYWYKYAMDRAWSELGLRHSADYAFPASQIVIYEHSAWHHGGALGIRNRSMINVAWLDGHVSLLTVRAGPSAVPTKATEISGDSAKRTGSVMYYNFTARTGQGHQGVADWFDPRVYSDGYTW